MLVTDTRGRSLALVRRSQARSIRPPLNGYLWTPGPLEAHGVQRYPFKNGLIDLACERRTSAEERPRVTVTSTVDVTLVLRWDDHEDSLTISGGSYVHA